MLLLCGQSTLVTNQVNNDVNINFIYAQSVFTVRCFTTAHPERKIRKKNRKKSGNIGKNREKADNIRKKWKKRTKSDAAIAQAVFITKG